MVFEQIEIGLVEHNNSWAHFRTSTAEGLACAQSKPSDLYLPQTEW